MRSKYLLKTSFSTIKQTQKYLVNSEAFAFLPRCLGSDFDMTSAESHHPKYSRIFPPSKVLSLIKGGEINFDDMFEVRGTSRGEDSTLQECSKFFNRHGIGCSQENISLSANILSALENIYARIGLNQSKKILVPTPTFGYYFKQFEKKDIGFETLATSSGNNFLPTGEELEKAIVGSGAVALLLCYPNNPTGVVMTEECARTIAEVTGRHGVFVISDEAFLNNSLTAKKHFPIAAVDGMLERSLTVTSLAKSMPIGLKTGFCVSHPDIVNDFAVLGGYPTKLAQKIMTASLEDSIENREYLEQCSGYYQNNIRLIKTKLAELSKKFCQQFGEEGICIKPFISDPEAANVYLLDFSDLRGKKYKDKIMGSGLDVSKWLLEEASIGTVPGECFLFDEKEMLVRIALNDPPQKIALAFDSAIAASAAIQNPRPSLSSASAGQVLISNHDYKII